MSLGGGRAGVGLAQSNVNVYVCLPSLFAFQNHSGVLKYIYNGRYYLKSMLNWIGVVGDISDQFEHCHPKC